MATKNLTCLKIIGKKCIGQNGYYESYDGDCKVICEKSVFLHSERSSAEIMTTSSVEKEN